MNKEQLQKTSQLIREYNADLFDKQKALDKIMKGKSKTRKTVTLDEIQEVLILIGILLSGNIKLRYETQEFIKENKAFANLTQLKQLADNSRQDLESLKSLSFVMVEAAKIIRHKEDEQKYKEQTL